MKDLEQDFCEDLIKDTTAALIWLDSVNNRYSEKEKKNMKAFTFDFKSLYDNLKPELVKEAVRFAMEKCRPSWSKEKCDWLISLIDISLRASVGKFKDSFYLQKNGVPTGGSLCVQLANIAVYYIMNKAVYSKPQLMANIKEAKRYIDDGAGFYTGSERSFKLWINSVNTALSVYGLFIDESVIKETNEYAPFLDIQFCFDADGRLQTDLFVKPTDARSYLSYQSAHPRHVFPGIVHSQCLRLRRIINDDNRLKNRLDELAKAFSKSGYPSSLLRKITTKVQSQERSLERKTSESQREKSILIVSCYPTDDKLVKTVKTNSVELAKTSSFKDRPAPLFKFVKKTASSVGSKLSVLRSIALGKNRGHTAPCEGCSNCQCCGLINSDESFTFNGHTIPCAPGSCKSKNVIYAVSCNQCEKAYIGRTVQPLRDRISGHRRNFYRVLANQECDESDDFSLGLHLIHEHNCDKRDDFNQFFKVQTLSSCNPSMLEKQEHLFIHRLGTLHPLGLNKNNPFGLACLSLN